MQQETTIGDEAAIHRSLSRIAHEIVEKNPPPGPLAFIGLQTRGVPLARRLAELVRGIDAVRVVPPAGRLDISFHRDDLATPEPKPTDVPFALEGTTVVLVDDVLFTGRTIRAALNAIADLGRPAAIRLAVLVDRGHRELPIRADHVGKNLPTARNQDVVVHLKETDGEDRIALRTLEAA